jgi:hypothetical protein
MANHTPGPWALGMNLHPLSENFGNLAIGPEESQESICVITIDNDRAAANARLIAAAPDLLEAVEMALEIVEGDPNWPAVEQKLIAARKKARAD